MNFTIASIALAGASPLSQSRNHDLPLLDGEGRDDYDARTWRSKLNVADDGTIVIPQHGMLQAIAAAGKYSGKQIPGQGKKTWTAKLLAGLMITGDVRTGQPASAARMVTISANADGVRGSGKRVTRRFPELFPWSAEFELAILDPIITEPVLREMLEIAGMFIGVGRFRPEKGGHNGRWTVARLDWRDARRAAA